MLSLLLQKLHIVGRAPLQLLEAIAMLILLS